MEEDFTLNSMLHEYSGDISLATLTTVMPPPHIVTISVCLPAVTGSNDVSTPPNIITPNLILLVIPPPTSESQEESVMDPNPIIQSDRVSEPKLELVIDGTKNRGKLK